MVEETGILDYLTGLDIKLFRFINVTLHNDFIAGLMKYTANDVFLSAVLFAGIFFALKNGGLKEKVNTAFALWAVIAVNILNSHILKNIFKRPRPPVVLEDIYFLVEMKYMNYAFPSTHTAMAAALASVLWKDYPSMRPLFAVFVFFVAFFCVYTGGHYPLDVLAGLLTGMAAGFLFNLLKKKVIRRYKK